MTEGYVYRDVLPFSAMVIMQSVAVGLNTLFKAATMEGMSYHVFVAYIHAIGALVLLLPVHFFSYRSRVVPPLSFHVVCKIGFLGMIGSSSQIMGYTGINYSSPTLDSAISNITPAFTFILAIAFRMEKIVVRRRWSQAKVIGAIVSIGGAIVVTLYKGAALTTAATSQSVQVHEQSLQIKTSQNWVLGGFFLTCQYILVPLWYIVQTQIMEYPDELTVVFLYNLVVSIVAAVVALITGGTSPTAWILGPNVALASVFCSGILGSCLNIIVHTWALRIKGPVFVAMFRPLSIVIALVMGVVFLGDTLHLGSLVGAAVISIGFYTMMWGKAQEEQDLEEEQGGNCSSSSSSQSVKALLLQK